MSRQESHSKLGLKSDYTQHFYNINGERPNHLKMYETKLDKDDKNEFKNLPTEID